MFTNNRAHGRRRSGARAAGALLAAAAWLLAASSSWAIGPVYVDAISDDDALTGTFGPNANLAPNSAFSTGATPDGLWGIRSPFAAESPTFSRYAWEAGGGTTGSAVEDVPEITQTISGLTPSSSYDVYVAYWSSNGGNWGIRAGLSSGVYQFFNRTGADDGIAGTRASAVVWNSPPTAGSVPISIEADRAMYLGKVGTTSANAQGRISVFLNDRPNTNDLNRTWLDGLAYAPAGAGLTLTTTINRATGNLSIVNNTGEAIHFTTYSVTSAASALKPASWLTIHNNYEGTDPGDLDADVWDISAPLMPFPAFAGTLSEIEFGGFDGATLPNGGGAFNLGNVWARSPFEDIQITLTLVGGATLTLAPQYTGTALANGDFNADGSLNLADYLTLRDHLQTSLVGNGLTRVENYAMGDVNGDNLVNHADFVAFRTSYIAVNGPGSFELIAGVPEPTGLALAGLATLTPVVVGRRRRAADKSHYAKIKSSNTGEQTTMSGMQSVSRGSVRPMIRRAMCAALAAVASLVIRADARAQLVTGWGLDSTLALATLTEGVPGSFSVTVPTGNAGPRALLASPISFANVGDLIQMRGTATMTNGLGNQQFRFGLYNPNGHATGTLSGGLWTGADVTGWLGYMYQVGGAGGTDAVRGRTGTGAGVWLSNTDAYIVPTAIPTTVSAPANTPYTFSLTLTRTGATSVKADYTFAGGAISRSGSFTDNNAGASASMTSFTAVGFLLNANTGGAQISNVIVEVPKLLRLRVNTANGFASIANKEVATTIATNYYEITSTNGLLTPASWLSLDGNIPASPTSWEKAGGSTANILSETNLLGTLAMGPQGPYQAIGRAFVSGGTGDLTFKYALPDGTLQQGIVEYVTGGLTGDFDVDGDVDGRDFLYWQRGYGSAFNSADLTNWKSTFGQTTPAVAAGQSVPEPACLALILASAAAVAGCRRRRRCG